MAEGTEPPYQSSLELVVAVIHHKRMTITIYAIENKENFKHLQNKTKLAFDLIISTFLERIRPSSKEVKLCGNNLHIKLNYT